MIFNTLDEKTHDDENSFTSLIPKKQVPSKVSSLVKTIAFGLNGLFISLLFVSSSKLLVALGKEGSGASSLSSTYQSVIVGSSLGPSYAAGLAIGSCIGRKAYSKVGEYVRVAWVLNIILGIIASGLMLVIGPIFPHIFSKSVSNTTVSYFRGTSIGNIAMLVYLVNVQLAMSQGHWFLPPLTGILLASGGAGIGYLLGFSAKLGAFGVGLGVSIAQILTSLTLMLCFLHPSYSKYQLFRCELNNFKNKIFEFGKVGWRLSFERLVEWGNLFLISLILGTASSETALRIAAPSIQYTALLASAFQSVSQATGILMIQNLEAQKQAKDKNALVEAESALKNNVAVFKKNIIGGMVVSLLIGAVLCIARVPAVKLFLKDPEPTTVELAVTTLWITMLPGLFFDSVRQVSIGGARAWGILLFPAIVSLICMTICGVPVGYGLTQINRNPDSQASDSALMFCARDVGILISAIIIGCNVRRQLNSEADILKQSIFTVPRASSEYDLRVREGNLEIDDGVGEEIKNGTSDFCLQEMGGGGKV